MSAAEQTDDFSAPTMTDALDAEFLKSAPPEPERSLANATRLVDPLRLNNLMATEITPRYLRRAAREVRRSKSAYALLRRQNERVALAARQFAQQGQILARNAPGQQKARQVQRALRHALEIEAHFDALDTERARFARRTAAATDLLAAWTGIHPAMRGRGRQSALRLRQVILNAERQERVTRERLDETRSLLIHLRAAVEAMRRNGEEIRLDPVTFTRFAGRTRWSVRLGVLALILVIVAAIYPPWSPPRLRMTCAGQQSACSHLSVGGALQMHNQGDGVLFGWVTVTLHDGQHATTQLIPFVLVPRADRTLTCADLATCSLTLQQQVSVAIFSSGGGSNVTIAP